jgi:hypothetical protein
MFHVEHFGGDVRIGTSGHRPDATRKSNRAIGPAFAYRKLLLAYVRAEWHYIGSELKMFHVEHLSGHRPDATR